MATNCIHNDFPETSIAQFSSNGQRAIVETSEGQVFSFDLARPEGSRFVEEQLGFHPWMWLQGGGGNYQIQPSGDFPFQKLETHLKMLSRVDVAIRSFEISLDSELDVDARKKGARRASELLRDVEVFAAVVPKLMANPMPPEFDITHGPSEGKAGELLQAMIAKWR